MIGSTIARDKRSAALQLDPLAPDCKFTLEFPMALLRDVVAVQVPI